MIKVLLVEDLCSVSDLIVDELSQIGIKSCIKAFSVNEATKILDGNSSKFDLIISDYDMPGDHGGNLLRHLYKIKSSIPFIFFTSTDELDLPETDENFLGIISKTNILELVSLIQSQLLQLKI